MKYPGGQGTEFVVVGVIGRFTESHPSTDVSDSSVTNGKITVN